jgi:hypothetical protein
MATEERHVLNGEITIFIRNHKMTIEEDISKEFYPIKYGDTFVFESSNYSDGMIIVKESDVLTVTHKAI